MALSDGIFAIVITLLVLEVRVPELTDDRSLRVALEEIRPSFGAFVISFLVVAIAWTAHRDLFSMIRLTDRSLIWLNLLYLLPLSLLPFAAALISRYERSPVALRIYGLVLLVIALTRVVWWYATGRPRLLYEPVDAYTRRVGVALVAIPSIAYVIAIAVADRSPRTSLAIYVGMPVVYWLIVIVAKRLGPQGDEVQGLT